MRRCTIALDAASQLLVDRIMWRRVALLIANNVVRRSVWRRTEMLNNFGSNRNVMLRTLRDTIYS